MPHTKEQILDRIIEQEIYVNASTMMTELSDGLAFKSASAVELWPECFVKDDYREVVETTIRNGTAVLLWDISERFGYELFTVDGVCLDGEPDEAFNGHLDTADFLENVEADDNWQEVAEYLDQEPITHEALQHWLVSDWLADKLEDHGALIARDVLGFNVWGRTECGQSLTMDGDLSKVADALLDQ